MSIGRRFYGCVKGALRSRNGDVNTVLQAKNRVTARFTAIEESLGLRLCRHHGKEVYQ